MDHGMLTDANGRKTDFRNVIIIMTTNVGAAEISRASIGFGRSGEIDGKEIEALKKAFSPEFRNRLNGIISFGFLPESVVLKIVKKFIAELERKLASKKIKLELTDAALKYLADKGYDPANGARPLARVIENEIKKPLSQMILFEDLSRGGVVLIDYDEEQSKLLLGQKS